MLDDVLWRLRRVSAQVDRLRTSIAMRGWSATLDRMREGSPEAPAAPPLAAPHAIDDRDQRPRMLVVDARVPHPDRDAGSLRLLAMLRLLAEAGWRIDFFADLEPWSAEAAARLADAGATLQHGALPAWLRLHADTLDVAMLCRAPVAAQYLPWLRRHAPRARIVFDTVDLHFLREERAGRTLGNARLQRAAARRRRRELQLVAASDLCLVVSEAERTLLADALPGRPVDVLGMIHDVHGPAVAPTGRADLLFVGGFAHPPNLDGMRWFLDAVWPHVLSAEPGMRVHVAGDLTREAREQLARERVVLHGRVPCLDALLAASRVSIAPLRFGAGIKGKVTLAMSHGLPVVATPVAAEGMHLRDGEDVLIADAPRAFADAILRAYRDATLWQRLSDGGRANVMRHFSTAVARDTLARLFPATRSDAAR